jgi:hypothetical protein
MLNKFKKTSILNVLTLIIIVCVFMSCKKKNDVDTYYIPDILREYTVFKEGSYWIYKNEVTGTLDSCFITGYEEFFSHTNGQSTDPYSERVQIDYKGSFMTFSEIDLEGSQLNSNSWGGLCLTPSVTPSVHFIDQYDTYACYGVVDSIRLNDHTYFSVLSTQLSQKRGVAFKYDTITLNYSFSRSIGLIRYRQRLDSSDTTWTLVRHHVVR